jgi:hypothetical protein
VSDLGATSRRRYPSNTGPVRAAGPDQRTCTWTETPIQPPYRRETMALGDRSNDRRCRTSMQNRRRRWLHLAARRTRHRTSNSPRRGCWDRARRPAFSACGCSYRSDPRGAHNWRARADAWKSFLSVSRGLRAYALPLTQPAASPKAAACHIRWCPGRSRAAGIEPSRSYTRGVRPDLGGNRRGRGRDDFGPTQLRVTILHTAKVPFSRCDAADRARRASGRRRGCARFCCRLIGSPRDSNISDTLRFSSSQISRAPAFPVRSQR